MTSSLSLLRWKCLLHFLKSWLYLNPGPYLVVSLPLAPLLDTLFIKQRVASLPTSTMVNSVSVSDTALSDMGLAQQGPFWKWMTWGARAEWLSVSALYENKFKPRTDCCKMRSSLRPPEKSQGAILAEICIELHKSRELCCAPWLLQVCHLWVPWRPGVRLQWRLLASLSGVISLDKYYFNLGRILQIMSGEGRSNCLKSIPHADLLPWCKLPVQFKWKDCDEDFQLWFHVSSL